MEAGMRGRRSALRASRVRAAVVYWVVVPAAVLGVGVAMDRLLGLPGMAWRTAGLGAGFLLVLAGVALIGRATRELERQGHGTPNPLEPPRTLVTSGPYGICRHPMFLGYDVAALGVILMVGSWGCLALSYPLFLGVQVCFLRREEERLAGRFGEAYERYREKTPFILPGRRGGRR